MDRNDEQQEILAAFALGALTEVEMRDFAAEIDGDATLAAELAEWRDAAATLAFAAPPVEPAPEVREKILAAISKKPVESNNGKAEIPQIAPQKSNVVPFPVRPATRRTFWSYAPTTAAIAASLVAVFLGVALYNSANKNAELNQKLAAAEQKLNDTQAALERERQERELLGSPATIVYALAGNKDLPTANARLVFDKNTGRALLFVEGLTDAPAGKVYQIWWINAGEKPAPGGVFHTGKDGKGYLRDQIPPHNRSAATFAVTVEPEGGSQSPNSEPVLISKTF